VIDTNTVFNRGHAATVPKWIVMILSLLSKYSLALSETYLWLVPWKPYTLICFLLKIY
jgi:hypothetical protein